jgi:hypothetical protein
MNVSTNTLQKYVDAFSESTVIEAVNKTKSRKSPGSIITTTNPIMRFLVFTTYEKNGRLYVKKNLRVPPEDYAYFRLVSAIVADLKSELDSNISYNAQLAEKILHHQSGPMLSAMNEILVAAYYKYLDIKVELNSSAQKGTADVDLVNLPYASDTKLFPNNRLLLEAIVNDSAKQIVNAVRLVRNQGLIIWIHEPNKKKIQKSLEGLAKAFEDPNAGHYSDDTLSASIMDGEYQGGDFHVNVQPQNVKIYFQASWDMAPAMDDLKLSIEKAVKQAKRLSKQAIPWIMVPRDANRSGIEMNALRFMGGFHGYVFNHADIFMMPVYALDFEGKGISTVFDVFQTGSNTLGVNVDTFQAFVKGLMNRPEMYI